jgi:autoinducer 2 (AI-2) kinase
VLEANVGPIGEGFAWLARLLHPDDARPEERFAAEAATAALGSAAMLANVGALVANDRQPAFPVGMLSLSHMTGTHGRAARASLARSVFEGMACAVRANLEQLARVTGRDAQRIQLAGGLSRSALFAQDRRGCHGRPVVRAAASESTGVGAALCAGVGAGVFESVAEAARRGRDPRDGAVEPRAPEAAAYHALYQSWSELRAAGESTTAPIAMRHTFPAALASAQRSGRRGAAQHRPRALVTAAFDDAAIARLRRFADVEYASFRDRMQLLTGSSLVKALEPYDVFVTEVDVVDAKALEQLPHLRVIAACRGDAVNVDVAACSAFGIPCCSRRVAMPTRSPISRSRSCSVSRGACPPPRASWPILPSPRATWRRWARHFARCTVTSSGRRRSASSGSARSAAPWRAGSQDSVRACSSPIRSCRPTMRRSRAPKRSSSPSSCARATS